MIAILEGIDAAGKSTAAQVLLERFGGTVRSFHHILKPDRRMEWMTQIEGMQTEGNHVFLDRLHLSELVYGPIVRGQEGLTPFENWHMEGWLMARNAFVLYLAYGGPETQGRLTDRYHGLVGLATVLTRYQQVMQDTALPLVAVEGLPTPSRVIEAVEKHLYDNSWEQGEGVGTQTPTTWIVGFQHNLKSVEHNKLHPNTCFSDGCGHHLHAALRVGGFTWKDLHISNAYNDQTELRDLSSRYHAFKEPQVVALGNLAAEALTKSGVPHVKVRHPQYARRFDRYNVIGYAAELVAAAGR